MTLLAVLIRRTFSGVSSPPPRIIFSNEPRWSNARMYSRRSYPRTIVSASRAPDARALRPQSSGDGVLRASGKNPDLAPGDRPDRHLAGAGEAQPEGDLGAGRQVTTQTGQHHVQPAWGEGQLPAGRHIEGSGRPHP